MSEQEGIKHDDGKLRLDLISVDSLNGLAGVLTYGATKYGDRNWENGLDWNRVYGAALRHLTTWWRGEDLDPESGLPHIDHAMCCLHFLSHYTKNEEYQDHDNRP